MKYLFFLFGLLSSTLSENDGQRQLPKEFSAGYNLFTANIYKELQKSSPGNFITSPLSLHTVLALLNSGARGQTAQQITTALHLPENQTSVHEIFTSLTPKLQVNDKYNLSTANKVYIMEKFNITDEFQSIAVEAFNSEIDSIDFSKNEEAATQINKWVQNQTYDQIKDLISPDLLSGDTRAVLVNALFFSGNWLRTFDLSQTAKQPFYLNKNESVETDMMYLLDMCEGYENDEAQFLKLDYVGGDVSMHIVLPRDTEGLAALEEKALDVLVPPKYAKKYVNARIPKFKIETKIRFKPILQSLGIAEVFGTDADLSGIGLNEKNLSVSEIAQKAFIDVDEKGTTAAAASSVIIDVRGDDGTEAMYFTANHPFLFYLRLNKLDINFFVGRYVSA